MKIKIDENLPESLALIAAMHGHVADTVKGEGLAGGADDVVTSAAIGEQRILVTQDLDFSDIRRLATEGHVGVILLRMHNSSRQRLRQRFNSLFTSYDPEQWRGRLVTVTETKVRIRRIEA